MRLTRRVSRFLAAGFLMIRTCLFDMGNVLVHFSHDRMCTQLGALCGRTGADIRRILFDTGVQLDFERGRMSEDEFQHWFEGQVGQRVERAALRRAGSDIFSLNEPLVPILDELKAAGIRLVLMSNTSVAHFDWVQTQYDVLSRFDDYVLSFRAGAVKPEAPIFECALEMIGCDPPECFYTDDIPQYIETGRSYGLEAEVFTDAASCRTHLRARGLRV